MEIKTRSYRNKEEKSILFNVRGAGCMWGEEMYYGGGSIDHRPRKVNRVW